MTPDLDPWGGLDRWARRIEVGFYWCAALGAVYLVGYLLGRCL